MSRLRSTSSRKVSQLVHDEEVFACERPDDVGNDGGPQSYHVTIGWAIKHGAVITGTPVTRGVSRHKKKLVCLRLEVASYLSGSQVSQVGSMKKKKKRKKKREIIFKTSYTV